MQKPKRTFLPENLSIKTWHDVQPFFEALDKTEIKSATDLIQWIFKRSELEAVLEEDMGWRYIRMSCYTDNEEYSKVYDSFIEEIEPKMAPYVQAFNVKMVESPFLTDIEINPDFEIYIRSIKKQIEIYREENIPLQTQLQKDAQQYGTIAGAMTVEIDGKELTLQQAARHLKDADRNRREEVYKKITLRRLQDKEKLNHLYSGLILLRHKVAINAGFKNYRDYMFTAMGRFDYTPADCFDFHQSIALEVTPMLDVFDIKRRNALGLDVLKPWDQDIDVSGKPPLSPFSGQKELIEKTIHCFNSISPRYAEYISIMDKMGHLDLESRKGKAPGGYNYPLYETGVPFIFMNAVGTLTDVVTMVHEGGHAIHSFLSRDLKVTEFKSVPSEVAELASMSMELISMEHWTSFFPNPEDLKRAKREQLEKVLRTLPWVATIDKFQHWVYTNPNHTIDQRYDYWQGLMHEFSSQIINWQGVQEAFDNFWQKQLHLFEVPFYYIEYGMAQLGAIAMWKSYKENPEKTLRNYEECLKLGYTRSIPELYKVAGIKFDFSLEYVRNLADFVKAELKKLSD